MYKHVFFTILLYGVLSSSSAETPKLVVRDQTKLTLAGAQAVLKAAEYQAEALGISENIAVVDDGGHLLAFERMDGSRPASVATAITKAVGAATMRRETGPVFKGASREDATFNLAIEHAAAANGGTLTILYGGIPIVLDGQVVGAIGVGGGAKNKMCVSVRQVRLRYRRQCLGQMKKQNAIDTSPQVRRALPGF